ncbi:hypothetical protein [uncultured Cohaesibacter sp.]|uniref:hypothetical protein n=1 Tax=uncultured Cohaesibacter sp. TaxID=1002546 RepID=UPI0029C659D9|nr:hypothetical protein [uncultured Cohaesibacter sp.]
MIEQHWSDPSAIRKYQGIIGALSEGEAKRVGVRAVNHAGAKTKTQVVRALTKQTGLKRPLIVKAVRARKANYGDIAYSMRTRGGDVSLKYFKPKEVRGGLTASPFGKRKMFDNHFMTSGLPGRRFSVLRLNGQVFEANTATSSWGRPMSKADSGVVIPAEMVKGATADAFHRTSGPALEARLEHELSRALL